MDKVNILFVDDEPNVLSGLKRALRPLRNRWNMEFVGNGENALTRLQESPFHVVVSDMRMPGMDGAQLLNEVLQRHPHVIRIVLSGYSDREMIMKSVGATHQYLSKPTDPDTLQTAVDGAMGLATLLNDEPALMPLIARIRTLPTIPRLYHDVRAELTADEPSIDRLAIVISGDPSMAAKVLQLVNSAFFGLRREVTSLEQAVSLLGIENIKTLILTQQLFAEIGGTTLGSLCLETLWNHSLQVGTLAQKIARQERAPGAVISAAMTAGMLHDVGKLILAANLTDQYDTVIELARREDYDLYRVEHLEFGATHAGLGAYLLGIWGLPDAIVEAVAFHHDPSSHAQTGFSALTAVHAANALVHDSREPDEIGESSLDMDHISEIGMGDRLPAWRQILDQDHIAA
jgi:putative nucleotidyltransferase with HDIG domain